MTSSVRGGRDGTQPNRECHPRARSARALITSALAFLMLVASAQVGFAQPPSDPQDAPERDLLLQIPCMKLNRGETLRLDVDSAPLASVVRLAGCVRGRNLVVDQAKLKGKTVSLVATTELDATAIWHLAELGLAEANLQFERSGKFWRVVPRP